MSKSQLTELQQQIWAIQDYSSYTPSKPNKSYTQQGQKLPQRKKYTHAKKYSQTNTSLSLN